MYSKNFFFNNTDFSTNNKKQNEIKFKSRCDSKYNNNLSNNLDNSKSQISQNKNIVSKKENNTILHDEKEDFYGFDIYKRSIGQCNFPFVDNEEILYNYKTISVANSFQKKFKEIFIPDKSKSYLNRNKISPIELSSELNLSFEAKYNKNITLGKPFNKDILHLNNIIRIVDKCHKNMQIINQKNFNNKYNHYYNYKSRINNYNYLKFKTKSKFSKKEHNKSLKKNYSTIVKSNIKISLEPIREQNKRQDKLKESQEYVNKEGKLEDKNSLKIKNNNEFSKINNNSSRTKNNFNNKITDIKLVHKENDQNKFIKNYKVPIALNKKIIVDKIYENPNSMDMNNSNRNSINCSSLFFYKYRDINNLNRKTKSILEETEKNNNNQSIKESIQFKDNIKKNKIIKIENIQNNRVIYKKIQRSEINKNQNKINSNPNPIKKEINTYENVERPSIKDNNLTAPINGQVSNMNQDNLHFHLNINKRKKNMYLSKNSYENTKNFVEKIEKEENAFQMNFGRSFIQSHQSTSQSLISEIKSNNYINHDSTKTDNNLMRNEDSKNTMKNSVLKIKNINPINYKSYIYKSDKANKTKMIFDNDNNKVMNSKNNNINQNKPNQKEDPNKDNLKTGRFNRRNIMNKKFEGEKINNDKINQGQDNQNSISTNRKDENPFRDKNEFYKSKRINNRFGNHKFHEINSTSCEKNNKSVKENKEKNNISNNIEIKSHNQQVSCSSMRYFNLRRKFHNANKEKDIDNKDEK